MKHALASALLSLLALVSCSGEEKTAEKPAPAAAAPKVTVKTNLGSFVIELNQEKAPITVKNFLSYVDKKHYDGTIFHRVMGNFMIQGGGFAANGDKIEEKASGEGIQNEAKNGLTNDKGTIAMARTDVPNSATAQFFVNVADNVRLNFPNPDGYGYAVFGKVVEGMDVVEKIKAVPTSTRPLTMIHPRSGQKITQDSEDVPNENVVIESITKVAP